MTAEIDRLVELAAVSRDLTTAALRRLVTRTSMLDPDHRDRVQRLLEAAPADAIAHPQLRTIERHRLSVRRGLSFRSIMIQRSEARHLGVEDRAWALDDKAVGYRFADALGVRRPSADLQPRQLDDVDPTPPVVVKPARSTGARGVYLVYRDRVVDVRSSEELDSWAIAAERAKRLMTSNTRRVRDRWITEEIILDGRSPARDLKFFCFYGKVVFVQEIERLPEFRATFWTPDGKHIETGKPALLKDGYGITKQQVLLAERISAEIPSPFMRIDMLRNGRKAAVVGEFTPRPGQFEQFNADTDRWLAEEWILAERRLLDDALAGKRFTAFESAVTP